jgi:hypothetical protein
MPDLSRDAQTEINSTGGSLPLVLLEINHSALSEPIRVVNDNQEITSGGNLFVAFPFKISLPDDSDGRLPKATLTIDNVGRELTTWLEASAGGRGATCTIMLVMRDAPDVVEYSITMELTNLAVSWRSVTGQLGFEDLLNRPAVVLQYRQDTAPGLFV